MDFFFPSLNSSAIKQVWSVIHTSPNDQSSPWRPKLSSEMGRLVRAQNWGALHNFDSQLYPCPALATMTIILSETAAAWPVMEVGKENTTRSSSPDQISDCDYKWPCNLQTDSWKRDRHEPKKEWVQTQPSGFGRGRTRRSNLHLCFLLSQGDLPEMCVDLLPS